MLLGPSTYYCCTTCNSTYARTPLIAALLESPSGGECCRSTARPLCWRLCASGFAPWSSSHLEKSPHAHALRWRSAQDRLHRPPLSLPCGATATDHAERHDNSLSYQKKAAYLRDTISSPPDYLLLKKVPRLLPCGQNVFALPEGPAVMTGSASYCMRLPLSLLLLHRRDICTCAGRVERPGASTFPRAAYGSR